MAQQVGYYTPKLQKRTLKGHSGPVSCLAHSSERLVIRDHHPRQHSRSKRRQRHPIDESTTTATTTTTSASAFEDDAQHDNNNNRNPSLADKKLNAQPNSHHHDHHHPSLLLSGSEDGTVRLWDLRTRKTSVCIYMPSAENCGDHGGGGNEVTSVAFYPSWADDIIDVDFDSSLGDNNEHTIYASTSNFVYGYDLRRYHEQQLQEQQQQQQKCSRCNSRNNQSYSATMRIIKGPAHFDLTPLFQCTDEINQLSFTIRRNVNVNSGTTACTPTTTTTTRAADLCKDGRYDILLSAADDSGEVHIIENPPSRCDNALHKEYMTSDDRMHSTIFCHAEPQTLGIVSCASFQPISLNASSSGLILATGGTDCTVKLWDVSNSRNRSPASSSSRGRKHRKQYSQQPSQQQPPPRLRKQSPPQRPTSTVTISHYETSGGGGGGGGGDSRKLWNPPYIHSLSWSASGKLLAAGVGDGSIAVYRVEGNKTLTEIGRLGRNTEVGCTNRHDVTDDDDGDDEEARAGHGSAVVSVRFANFGGSRGRGVVNDEGDDRLLLSAGNDGTLIAWDLGGNMVGRGPLDPMQYLLRSTAPSLDGNGGGGGGGGCQQSSQSLDSKNIDNDDFTPSPPRLLFKIAHRHKPNWMTCSPSTSSSSSSSCLPGTIFVADVTKDISAYTLAEN